MAAPADPPDRDVLVRPVDKGAEVVTLPGIERSNAPEPDELVVSTIRTLLERAEKGEIRSIAYAVEVFPAYSIATSWTRGLGHNGHALAGAVSHLLYRLNKNVDENV